MLHATVRLNLDLALPHLRNAPGRIPATNGAAWYPTAHSRAASEANGSSRPETESRGVNNNQQPNKTAASPA
jgi:hypothetical protein